MDRLKICTFAGFGKIIYILIYTSEIINGKENKQFTP